jgi:hypothetical protein
VSCLLFRRGFAVRAFVYSICRYTDEYVVTLSLAEVSQNAPASAFALANFVMPQMA